MIFCSLAEVVSIGTILPFLAVLTAPERLFEIDFVRISAAFVDITDPQQLLFPLTLLFATAALVSGGLRLLLLWAQTRISYSVGADLSISIYRRCLYQPYLTQISRNSSELIAGISGKASNIVHFAIVPILVLASSCLIVVAIASTLLVLQPTVAVIAFLGFAIIYSVVILTFKKRLKLDSDRLSQSSTEVIKALQEGLGGIRDVLLDGTQNLYSDIYKRADLSLRVAQANISVISSSPRFVIEALGIVLIAGLAFGLASRSEGIGGAVPLLGALALGAQRLLPILQQAYSSWAGMRGGQTLLEDSLDLLEQPLPPYANQPPADPIPFEREISLNSVAFRYPSQPTSILRDIQFAIPKGARIGIVGTTGSGKSTLLDILMGLLTPTDGALKIDNREITSANCRSWQAHIAHVPQVIFLADTSIAANIAFGCPPDQIDYSRIKQCAEQAQIASTIEKLPEGYETKVGERGVRLSGGQRQRIGIARALYKKANVIVFDEATSALDDGTENDVMSAINGLSDEITLIMVAHRLSTLRNCTQIVEVQNGTILSKVL
jgi:ABC-type bacteriocin/lantibiotic exporter with double-glycine peptidase domain